MKLYSKMNSMIPDSLENDGMKVFEENQIARVEDFHENLNKDFETN